MTLALQQTQSTDSEADTKELANPLTQLTKAKTAPSQTAFVKMSFAGANASPEVSGLEELEGKTNYFYGNTRRTGTAILPITRKCNITRFIPVLIWFTMATVAG